jgi:hypothetical protein
VHRHHWAEFQTAEVFVHWCGDFLR